MNNSVANKLIALRKDVPRKVVADEIGIPYNTLQAYELGTRIPRDDIKVRIAQYYKVSVESIFYADVDHVSCSCSCEK